MPALSPPYAFDPTGLSAANRVVNEQHVLTPMNFQDYHFVVPDFAPFFENGLTITHTSLGNVTRTLVPNVDYILTHWFIAASRACAEPIYGSISLLDLQLTGSIKITYQTLGGIWLIDSTKTAEILGDRLRNPRITSWDVVSGMPQTFPPVDHEWDLQDLVGLSAVLPKLTDIATAIATYQVNGLAAYRAANDVRVLRGWAVSESFVIDGTGTAPVRNTSGGLLSANIIWPDGVTGVFTADTINSTYPWMVDAWHATYAGAPGRLVTQSLISRDADGNVINQPLPTVT